MILFRRLADGKQKFCGNTEVLLEEYTVTEKGGEQGGLLGGIFLEGMESGKKYSLQYSGEQHDGTGTGKAGKAACAGYTVQRGDSLWSIAKKQLGMGRNTRKIARKNGIANPNRIYRAGSSSCKKERETG